MSEVYYVERDGNGAVVAVYGVPQPGITDPEPLPETDPEVAAILNPPAPPPEPQTLEDYRAAIRAHVDATAQTRDYDNAVSCASYVNSTNPTWADEASAFVAWRDQVWGYAFAELKKVENGQRQQPSIEAFIAELPPIEWPTP